MSGAATRSQFHSLRWLLMPWTAMTGSVVPGRTSNASRPPGTGTVSNPDRNAVLVMAAMLRRARSGPGRHRQAISVPTRKRSVASWKGRSASSAEPLSSRSHGACTGRSRTSVATTDAAPATVTAPAARPPAAS